MYIYNTRYTIIYTKEETDRYSIPTFLRYEAMNNATNYKRNSKHSHESNLCRHNSHIWIRTQFAPSSFALRTHQQEEGHNYYSTAKATILHCGEHEKFSPISQEVYFHLHSHSLTLSLPSFSNQKRETRLSFYIKYPVSYLNWIN